MPGIEKIDKKFKPPLPQILSQDGAHYVVAVGLSARGKPAPTTNGSKAAVWVGTNVDAVGEFPVLAVCTRPSESIKGPSARWSVGFILAEALQDTSHIESSAPREALLLQSAEHGNFLRLEEALHLLIALHTNAPLEED